MRMWMVNPKILCRKHLMGEHVETHMFLGSFQKKKSIEGFVRNNCAQPLQLQHRHDVLAAEMIRRGYKHNSPMQVDYNVLNYLPDEHKNSVVDSGASLSDLIGRCSICRKRYIYLRDKEVLEQDAKKTSDQ